MGRKTNSWWVRESGKEVVQSILEDEDAGLAVQEANQNSLEQLNLEILKKGTEQGMSL